MTTDNRTNELTLEQVEAAFEEGMDAIDWGMVRNGEGDPQEAAGIAVRAALVAAQGAAPQAESEVDIYEQVCRVIERAMSEVWNLEGGYDALPEVAATDIVHRFNLAAPVLPSSGVDEDKLAEVIARVSHRAIDQGANPRVECVDSAEVARAVAEWLKEQDERHAVVEDEVA